MQLSDFDYTLPEDLIATAPVTPRDHARFLIVNRTTGQILHKHFYDLPEFLNAGDLLVLNNTKVIPARLFTQDAYDREFEIVLLEKKSHTTWTCLVRPGKKIKTRTPVRINKGTAYLCRLEDLSFEIEFPKEIADVFFSWIGENGRMPLPPYIKRAAGEKDKETYQTVFAEKLGSVAAPTASLHFTHELLQKIKDKGVQVREVTLHVGYGTFAPIQTDNIQDHPMHAERYEIPADLPAQIAETKKWGGKVVAAGTTALRTLESYPTLGLSGETRLFIKPGDKLQVADQLITNFHVPKSSLFVLVCALLGTERAKEIYQTAIAERYRFYSYGDATFII